MSIFLSGTQLCKTASQISPINQSTKGMSHQQFNCLCHTEYENPLPRGGGFHHFPLYISKKVSKKYSKKNRTGKSLPCGSRPLRGRHLISIPPLTSRRGRPLPPPRSSAPRSRGWFWGCGGSPLRGRNEKSFPFPFHLLHDAP